MGFASLALHREGSIMRAARDAIVIDGVIDAFDFQLVFQGNICFFKGRFLQ